MRYKLIDSIKYYVLTVNNDSKDRIIIYEFQSNELLLSLEIICNQGEINKLIGFENLEKSPMVLSFSNENIKMWNIELTKYNANIGKEINGIIVARDILFQNCIIKQFDNKNLLIGSNKRILTVLNIKENSPSINEISTLKIKGCNLISDLVAYENENLLMIMSLCSDKTFIIFKYPVLEVVYQSTILSSNPLSCLLFNEHRSQFLIGSVAGEMIFFSFSTTRGMKILYRLRLHETSSFTNFNDNNSCLINDLCDVSDSKWEADLTKLSISRSPENQCGIIHLIHCDQLSYIDKINSHLHYFGVGAVSLIIISTISGLFLCNFSSYEIFKFYNWSALEKRSSFNDFREIKLFTFKENLLLYDTEALTFTTYSLCSLINKTDFFIDDDQSMIAQNSLLPSSILEHVSLNFPRINSIKVENKKKLHPKSHSIDQPLTFKTKIKSSGYAKKEPIRQLFKPVLTTGDKKERKNSKTFMFNMKIDYPSDGFNFSNLNKEMKLDTKPININCIKSSNHGNALVCCLANGSCHILDSKSLNTIQVVQCDENKLTNAHWSLEDKYLILTTDGGIDIFSRSQARNILKIKKSASEKSNIKNAQFFLMDRFFHYSCGSKLKLLEYRLDENKDDIMRYKNTSIYKCVYEWKTGDDYQITASSSINQFYSYVMIIASSDYRLTMLDLNNMKTMNEIHNCHDRKIDHIAINQGSLFSNPIPFSFNCFATSTDSGVKLWDLRINKCIQHYWKPKITSRYPNSVQFTPCGQYIGTIMEESINFYDIRSTKFICSFRSNTDCYSDLTFNPRQKMVYAATNNTKIEAHLLN